MKKYTQSEFDTAMWNGQKDFSYCDLSNLDIYPHKLDGVNMSFSDLENSNLCRCDLSKTNLYGASLYNAQLPKGFKL
jgi:uncharacterized protein YjbI with pentapeptide repeats